MDPANSRFDQIATPALLVDVAALDQNIRRMADAAAKSNILLRPHAKTHKSVDIALRQLAAGAIGISCATLAEAEGLAQAGVGNLFITSPVMDPVKISRLMELHRRSSLIVTVDHPDHVRVLEREAREDTPPLAVVIDIDVGQRRTGVVSSEDGVALARLIANSPRLKFAGLQGFAGHAQHIVDVHERREAARHAGEIVRDLEKHLTRLGLSPQIISGSGTGTFAFDSELGPYSELQVGSYLFMDADYGRLRDVSGGRLPFQNALFVLTTVVSANVPGQITVDAGTKALAVNGPMPDRFLGIPDGSTYRFGGDEHGMITLPVGVQKPDVGARVMIAATHCDPTVNLHASYRAVGSDGRVSSWPIIGRYGAS